MAPIRIVALEGDQTGQELLEQALRVLVAAAALLHHAAEAGAEQAEETSRAVYESVLEATAAGVRTPDLSGHAGTTEFTDEVIARMRARLGSPSSVGAAS